MRIPLLILIIILLFGSLILITGCSLTFPPVDECTVDSDCNTGYVCMSNSCETCPIPECAAPPPDCNYISGIDVNGCETCGELVCEPSCVDGVQNQGEIDVDCGGPCPDCDLGKVTCYVTKTLTPSDDAYVDKANPTQNLGSDTFLSIDLSPDEYNSYLKFFLPVNEGVQSATLRLKVQSSGTPDSSNGGTVYASSTNWDENSITWNNKPATSGTGIPKGRVNVGQWVEWDVSNFVSTGVPSEVSFAVIPGATDGADYESKESQNSPELVVSIKMEDPSCTTSPPSCTDGVKNGQETDVDCGGATCNGCSQGKSCNTDSDCDSVSFVCESTTGTCLAPSAGDSANAPVTNDVMRSFSSGTVSTGGSLSVTVDVKVPVGVSYYFIEEFVPSGWSITNTGGATKTNNELRWADIQGATDTTFTYTVTAPSTTGAYTWDGQYQLEGMSTASPIGGSTSVTVQ